MIVGATIVGLFSLTSLLQPDPAPGVLRSKTWARNLECEHLDAETAAARFPGRVTVSAPRGDFIERSTMICVPRFLAPGVRAPRDEAILSGLAPLSRDIATAAAGRRPDLRGHTWLVDSFYPSAEVSAKLSFAAKNALLEQGLQVSDRVPMLAIGDAEVLTRLPPGDAYPAACGRYAATGALGARDVLVMIVSRDPRETTLHAGICVDGGWTWLL